MHNTKLTLLAAIATLAAVLACTGSGQPLQVQPNSINWAGASIFQQSTQTPACTCAPTPTPTNTPAPTPTQLPTPLPYGGELLRNGGFETFRTVAVHRDPASASSVPAFAETHFAATHWHTWYCAERYTTGACAADYISEGKNPPGLKFGRPEYKQTTITRERDSTHYRVWAGASAQQWFNVWRVDNSGIQQVVFLPTLPSSTTCKLQFYFQPWISDGTTGLTSLPPLPRATADDKLALRLLAQVSTAPALQPGKLLLDEVWSHNQLVYDDYKLYDVVFTLPANTPRIYVIIGTRTAWPWPTQNFYVDNASLRCRDI